MAVTACVTNDSRLMGLGNELARRKVDVTIPNGETNGTTTIGFSGRISRMSYDVPDLTGAGTLTVDLNDEDGTNLYQKASIAENAKTNDAGMVAAATPHGIVFMGKLSIKCTASAGAQTGDQLISVILHYI